MHKPLRVFVRNRIQSIGARQGLQAWDASLQELMTAPVQRAGPDPSFDRSQQALLILLVQPYYAIASPAMLHAQAALL
jgi:hypothetical protein